LLIPIIKALKTNAVTRFFSLFLVITLSCFAALSLVFSETREADLGIFTAKGSVNRIYRSEPFSFYLEGYEIFLPQGSMIVPLPLNDAFTGLAFLGEGAAVHRGKNISEKITGGYLVVDTKTYLQLKGDTLFLPVEDRLLASKLAVTFQQLIQNPAIHSLGFERIFLPPAGSSHLYLENDGVPLVQPVIAGSYNFLLSRLILYFSLVIAIVLLVAQLLTLDLKPSYNLSNFLRTPPVVSEKILSMAVLIILFLAHRIWPVARAGNPFRSETNPAFFFLYLGLLLIINLLIYKGKIPPQFAGLQWRQFPRDAGLALVISLIITVFSTLQIPSVLFGSGNIKQLFWQFIYFFSWAAVFELVWRGFLQTTLERIWGRKTGLLISTLLFTGIFFISAYGNIPEQSRNILLLCELLFFVPGTALILGYIYQLTRSILGSTLTLTMLFFLPRLLS